ncbi:uncharacterized protein LOC141713266 [Apium graveolens]|uniref:uncharacterized protein LOC141713266 n=1 Tax=Apium graveolens TaxID=4045 RepID=UPI003D7A9B66
MKKIGNDVFAFLVDESSDVFKKEQMDVFLQYVDDTSGTVKERFVGLVHVKETSLLTLKSTIDSLFFEFGLSLGHVRGQGYDGACNMQGQFNGLKILIMGENSSAYYIHYFAHQLQLVVMAIAKKLFVVGDFLDMIAVLMNVVGGSCKETDMLRDSQRERLLKEMGHEVNDCFNEVNSEMLICMASLTLRDSFVNFDPVKDDVN